MWTSYAKHAIDAQARQDDYWRRVSQDLSMRPLDHRHQTFSPLMCRFLDAGMTNPSTRCGGRRPKSAKARNRGTYAGAEPRALWGFCRRFGLVEVGLKRSPRSACGEPWWHASV